jgi:hypothetical protein
MSSIEDTDSGYSELSDFSNFAEHSECSSGGESGKSIQGGNANSSQIVQLDPRIVSYFSSFLKTDTIFDAWNLPKVMLDIERILQAGKYVCLCIAANVASGKRVQVKTSFYANPTEYIKNLNNRKRKGGNADKSNCGWKMLAFLVASVSKYGERTLCEIQKRCKSQRRLHDRIITLMEFAFDNKLPLRICEEIIMKDNFWYMPDVSNFLNKQKTFITHIKTRLGTSADSSSSTLKSEESMDRDDESDDTEDTSEDSECESEDDIHLDMNSGVDDMDMD